MSSLPIIGPRVQQTNEQEIINPQQLLEKKRHRVGTARSDLRRQPWTKQEALTAGAMSHSQPFPLL